MMKKITIAFLINALLVIFLCPGVLADDPPIFTSMDAYVDFNEKTTPHNGIKLPVDVSILFGDLKPTRISYLKFDVSGITRIVGSASKIRLYTISASYTGFNMSIWSTDDNWNATEITWDNAPAALTKLDTQPAPMTKNVWVEFTGAALANYINTERVGDGIASFKIQFDSCSTCGIDFIAFYDFENGGDDHKPNLELETPTGFDVAGFFATPSMDSIQIQWNTGNETDLQGFNLYRSLSEEGLRQILNPTRIDAKYSGTIMGASYTFGDAGVHGGTTYYYWLEMVGFSDSTFLKDPVIATANHLVYLPVAKKVNTPLRYFIW